MLGNRGNTGSAEAIEGLGKILSDRVGIPTFDILSFEHVSKLAVSQQRNRRRGGLIPSKVASRPRCGFAVLTSKYGPQHGRTRVVLQRDRHGRTRSARS